MSFKSKVIALTYGLRMSISRWTGLGIDIRKNTKKIKAPHDFYALKAQLNGGEEISFEQFRGKKVLIVNLASQCGFTPQYKELERLHLSGRNMIILGFPSNNFGSQEPGSDKQIAEFCSLNFGVTFPLFKKDEVIGSAKQPVYQWLTDKSKNGWNELEPRWNFHKYLIDQSGNLESVISSSVSPQDI